MSTFDMMPRYLHQQNSDTHDAMNMLPPAMPSPSYKICTYHNILAPYAVRAALLPLRRYTVIDDSAVSPFRHAFFFRASLLSPCVSMILRRDESPLSTARGRQAMLNMRLFRRAATLPPHCRQCASRCFFRRAAATLLAAEPAPPPPSVVV